MNNPRILSVLNNLDKHTIDICQEVDDFMANIMNWADELESIIEKEYSAGKESTMFLLPKTPCEKKTRNRKGRNALVSKCSEMGAEITQNEITNLDETTSVRTRGGRRAAASKISQLTATIEMPSEETRTETTVTKTNTKDVTDATFVLPKANTRTKPVMKNKEPEPIEPKEDQNQLLNTSNRSPVKESSPVKKISKSLSKSPRERSRRTSEEHSVQQNATEVLEPPMGNIEIPIERLSRSRVTRNSNGSGTERTSKNRLSRSQSERSSKVQTRSPSNSPVARSSSLRSSRSNTKPSVGRQSRNNIADTYILQSGDNTTREKSLFENITFLANQTVTIKKEKSSKGLSTYIVNDSLIDGEGETSPGEKTPIVLQQDQIYANMENLMSSTRIVDVPEVNGFTGFSMNRENITEEVEEIEEGEEEEEQKEEAEDVPKKKRKVKKDEEVKENVEENVRITRTKSKALKKMIEENEANQADLSAIAKKLLNKAKMTSQKKNQLAALLECNNASTPTNGLKHIGNNLPFGNLTASKSKYHLLLSGSKKLKTPLATLPNSAVKIVKASGDKIKVKVPVRDSSVENVIRSVTKPTKDNIEKEIKLQSRKEKEKEAILKRENVIKTKQEELKRKNELKHQMAMKQREKLEQEKYKNMIQSEKEKEERHKLILQERQIKQKEEALKKKMLTQQKIAETVERRRLEEEARLAKLKEMEAEEQRLALEKQKEQERQEKRAQERLAQKKAREEYEMQLKQEMEAERLRAEKLLTAKKCLASASKARSGSKRQKFGMMGEKREWDYKPRHENDYGLEDEESEIDSGDEKPYEKSKPAVPWGKKIMIGQSPIVRAITLEMLCEFMPCHQKSPDIYKMFRMTPSKRIKRSSSAIWNTPSS